jgi:hypothetical protein
MYIVHIISLKINIWTLIFYSNLKIDISIMKTTILIFKKYIRIWNLIFESENWHFNFGNCYLNSKNLFDLKINIWILYYYFQI